MRSAFADLPRLPGVAVALQWSCTEYQGQLVPVNFEGVLWMFRLVTHASVFCLGVSVITFSEYVAQAEIPPVPTGTGIEMGVPFGEIARDVASMVLPDGRLMGTGDSDREGSPCP
jgi:hypothetical protein